jgi:hypothetical protein
MLCVSYDSKFGEVFVYVNGATARNVYNIKTNAMCYSDLTV